MKNLEESNEIVSELSANYLNGPVGNKLEDIIEQRPLTRYIDKIMAKSFIKNAQHGMLSTLLQNNINFNVGGIYELDYSLLKNICDKMISIGADHLVLIFVEVGPDDERLSMNGVGSENMLYAIASLIKGEDKESDENNYFIINAKKEFSLEDLRITHIDKEKLRCSYVQNSHEILKGYFSINDENTQSIHYHIDDIKKTLKDEEGKCDIFKVYLCEISDVEKVILEYNSSLTITPEVYRKHFQFREKQMTLVFNSEDRYYDMGGLRP